MIILWNTLYESIIFVHSFPALLSQITQTMIKNHNLFANTSIAFMVGRVILLLKCVQQILKGCLNFRESSTILGKNQPWTCY